MNNISVVYKIGGNKKWSEYECLRYSIRSVAKNFKNLQNIILVGIKPSWVSEHIIHIPAEDKYKKNKDASIIEKLLLACEDVRVTQDFLNCSDDQLIIYPLSTNLLVPFTIDSDLRRMKGKHISTYGKRMKNTIDILKSQNLPCHSYEIHCPVILNKEKFKEILSRYDYTKGVGYVSNSLYFNNLLDNGENPVENIRAFLKKSSTTGQIITACRGKLFLGYQKRALNNNLKEYLRNTFREKSIYEK